MKKLWPIIPILLFGLARAGDTTLLTLTGFSGDGAYVAFQETAIGDGSGFPHSVLGVVDVSRNTLVYRNTTSIEISGATENQARAKAATQAVAVLKKYGIQPGDQGRFVFGNFAGGRETLSAKTSFEFAALGRTYSLEVITRDLPLTTKCDMTAPQLLEVRLSSANANRVLQRDTKLPASRGCAYAYQLHSVFLKGSGLVVFFAVYTPGFEGPNLDWMAVTAKL